jgi:hypothetical protein
MTMRLNCPKCAAEISAENINLERLVAKCSQCDSVFNFEDKLSSTYGVNSSAVQQQRFAAPRPDKVTLDNFGGVLTLQWRWFTWVILLVTGIAVFWNGIVLSMFGSVLFDGLQGGDILAVFPLFVIPHFWVGLAMIYYVLTGYINKTTVTVKNGRVAIRHAPLPWWGNKEVEAATIMQIYTKENNSRYRRGIGTNNTTYELHAVLKKGRHLKLLSGLDSSEHALFVEREIEEHLGIEDVPVRGEYGR